MGIHVRVHPFFWLIALFLGMGQAPWLVVGWVGVLFVSILVHEMGHALTMRHFGLRPRVLLYGMGGLAIADSGFSPYGAPRVGPREKIIYTLAGPVAGFLLAAVVGLLWLLLGGRLAITLERFPIFWDLGLTRRFPVMSDMRLLFVYSLFQNLLYVNIFWGLVNLLPVLPLDGGQITREVLMLKDPWQGQRTALTVSLYVSAAMAIYGLVGLQSMWVALIFGMLAFQSYQTLNSGGHY